jgi:hypothetical protein
MMDKPWSEMTPAERMQHAINSMANPCQEHDYEDSVNILEDATMLQQICRVCFYTKGWIYGRDTRE